MLAKIMIPSFVGAALLATSVAMASPVPMSPRSSASGTGLDVIYDADTGNLSATAPSGSSLTALQVTSESGLFNGTCGNLNGPFDVCTDEKVFVLNTNGFESFDYGNVLATGLSASTLLSDLKVDGATAGGGFDVGTGPYFVAIPEPTSILTLLCGFAFLFAALCGRVRV